MGGIIETDETELGARHTTPTLRTAEARRYIMEKRLQNISFPEIARQLGVTQGYVYKQYKKALREIYAPDTKAVRKMEELKIDNLERKVYEVLETIHPLVSGGDVVYEKLRDEKGRLVLNEEGDPILVRLVDSGPILSSVDRLLKLMERRAKLRGLDAPAKTAFTDPSGENAVPTVQYYIPDNGRDETKEEQEERSSN